LHPTYYYYAKVNRPSIYRKKAECAARETQLPESTFTGVAYLVESAIYRPTPFLVDKGQLWGREGKGRGMNSKATSPIEEWVSFSPRQRLIH
jgi:hypothetical protein